MSLTIDDHFLLRYRELLDEETTAFDGLEHACEDGDRMQFDAEMEHWQVSLARRMNFLSHAGMEVPVPA